eukprot:CAMPEP_0185027304 /NCGR_PEP_ID=MMETSP1103-20130426/12182_1 /TAXON_ID=36769 /ORGANISM="Paraphysomonas bandaiensis, Strain Caron Lab Isolate" /LENGTH=401 /DNA_ID=CAMNT_0027561237 /DNA_START=270 /DNA_END=1475 /DNA_ORIENTATION=-
MTLNNNELYGSYGGCYANCDARVYADKGVQLSSCSSPSDCKNRAGGLEFVHICPCYDDGSGSSTLLSVWEIIGISAGVFFFLLIVMGLAIYFYLIYFNRDYEFNKLDESSRTSVSGDDKASSDIGGERKDGTMKDWALSQWELLCASVRTAYTAVSQWISSVVERVKEKKQAHAEKRAEKKSQKHTKQQDKKSWLKKLRGLRSGRRGGGGVKWRDREEGWYKEDGLPAAYTRADEHDEDIRETYDNDAENEGIRPAAFMTGMAGYLEHSSSSSSDNDRASSFPSAPPPLPQHRAPLSGPPPPLLSSQVKASSAPPLLSEQRRSSSGAPPPPLLSQSSSTNKDLCPPSDSDDIQSPSKTPGVWQAAPGKLVTVKRHSRQNWEQTDESSVCSESSLSRSDYQS